MRSVRVVFPESMWALMPIFRMREMSWAMRRGKLHRPDQTRQPFEMLSLYVGERSAAGGLMPGSRSDAQPRARPTLGGPRTRVSLATGRGIPAAHAIGAAVASEPVARRSLS